MSGIATAIVGGAVIGAGATYASSKKSAKASEQAAQTAADAERQKLEYLQEINKVPQQFREEALQQLGGLYGLEGGEGSQQALINQAKQSPLYQALMETRKEGEDAILRNAAATGGLRSGNIQEALAQYNSQLAKDSLLAAYKEQLLGLQGLAQVRTNENAIANTMGNIGSTLAQGQIAAAQAQQAGLQGIMNTVGTGINQYLWAKGKGLL